MEKAAEDFFNEIKDLIGYWASQNGSKEKCLNGFVHSLLVAIDGAGHINHMLDILINGQSIYDLIGEEGQLHEIKEWRTNRTITE